MSHSVNPPEPWFDARPCPCDGCDTTRYTTIGMDLHLLHDHDAYPVRDSEGRR